MTAKRISVGAVVIAVIVTLMFVTGVLSVNAQSLGDKSPTPATPKEMTYTGRIVDLHCFMTGEMPSADAAKCTADCIRAGVPAALETSNAIYVLGQGMHGPSKTLLPFAHQDVQVRGKLFEKGGIKYLDFTSVQKAVEKMED